jgi:hypothetical protein
MIFRTLKTITFVGASFILFSGCGSGTENASTPSTDPQLAFFNNIKAQCGASFTGSTEFSSSEIPNDPFVINPLKMQISECSDSEIRMPFYVGADSSRTWILTLTPDGLLFKHQHLLADGTPDTITNYGGMSDGTGTEWDQHFPADAFTASLDSLYTTNKWSLILDVEKGIFDYKLQRHSKPRFEARLMKD